jgi:hypothetical protein
MVDARPRLKMLEKVFLAAIASRQDGLPVWLHEGVQVVVSGYIERPLVEMSEWDFVGIFTCPSHPPRADSIFWLEQHRESLLKLLRVPIQKRRFRILVGFLGKQGGVITFMPSAGGELKKKPAHAPKMANVALIDGMGRDLTRVRVRA